MWVIVRIFRGLWRFVCLRWPCFCVAQDGCKRVRTCTLSQCTGAPRKALFQPRIPIAVAVVSAFWDVSLCWSHIVQSCPIGAEPVENVQEKSKQVHVALLAFTECESFDIVLGSAPSGLEALRRLVRRWDPLSGGKRRALLRQILVPDRCKLQDLPAGLEKWEELVRQYEWSKSSGTTTTALDDDIKTAALETFVPSELEQHLAMNRARLITYEQVRS